MWITMQSCAIMTAVSAYRMLVSIKHKAEMHLIASQSAIFFRLKLDIYICCVQNTAQYVLHSAFCLA